MDSSERGMNPVAMAIINPRKEYWPNRGSNQRPTVLKFGTLPTELRGSAFDSWKGRQSLVAKPFASFSTIFQILKQFVDNK